jgi:hypothetical protein
MRRGPRNELGGRVGQGGPHHAERQRTGGGPVHRLGLFVVAGLGSIGPGKRAAGQSTRVSNWRRSRSSPRIVLVNVQVGERGRVPID